MERQSGDHLRRETQPEQHYLRAAKYGNDAESLRAYTASQAIIFASNVDLSSYRIRLSNVPHVVVLGLKPNEDVDAKLREALANGVPAELPSHIVDTLRERRNQAKRIGPWVEGHYRPGKPM